MCKFKSGIITKAKIYLAPMFNESHSVLLRSLHIEDSDINAMKMFVRAELVPPKNDKRIPVSEWKYIVDQDVVPDWYEKDPERYENEFREAVTKYMVDAYIEAAGRLWTAIKEDEYYVYYLLDGILERSSFGETNDCTLSAIRKSFNSGELLKQLKSEFGDKLSPITTNLTSLDGLKDYGEISGDFLAIPSIDLYRECREKIPCADEWWWLATPDSTPSGCGSDFVVCVSSDGDVNYNDVNCYGGGVRPFFIVRKH